MVVKYLKRITLVTNLLIIFMILFSYGSLAQAVAKPDGLGVLATLVHLQRGNNEVWNSLFGFFEIIQQPRVSTKPLRDLTLASFVPTSNDFYR